MRTLAPAVVHPDPLSVYDLVAHGILGGLGVVQVEEVYEGEAPVKRKNR